MIVKLRCVDEPKVTFLISTTHLLYNPKREDIRLAQLMILLAELDRCSLVDRPDQRIPIIVTGDFNFKPDSAPFELITVGQLCYKDLTRKTLKAADDGDSTNRIGKQFITCELGITDNCQHVDCLKRNEDESCKVGLLKIVDLKRSESHHVTSRSISQVNR